MFNKIKEFDSLYSVLPMVNSKYQTLSQEARKEVDTQVIQVMKKAETENRKILELKKQIQNSPETMKKVNDFLTASQKFLQKGIEAAKEKEQKEQVKEEEKTKSFIQKVREEVKEISKEMKRKPEEKKKEKGLMEKLEEGAMKLTEEKRKMLASNIEERLGQGSVSKKITSLAKDGYKYATAKKWVEVDQGTDEAINLAFELNDLRNELVEETVNLILKPRETLQKYDQY